MLELRRQSMSDTRLIERAIAERWEIPDALRPGLVKKLAKIMDDDASSPREVVSAAKAILSASKINLESITTEIKAQEHEELIGRPLTNTPISLAGFIKNVQVW
jgi:hypothetical protein